MEKTAKFIVIGLLAALFILPAYTVHAQDKDVLTLNGSEDANGKVSVSGTVEDGMLAVALAVYDETGKTQVTLESTGVQTGNTFSYSFDLTPGTYVVRAADYDGGDIVETKVSATATAASTTAAKKSPKTGDAAPIAGAAVLGLLGLAGVAFSLAGRKVKK